MVHLFQLQLQSYPLTLYHIDRAALARCTALIDDRDAAATALERMVARILAALSRPKAAECTKGASARAREAVDNLFESTFGAMASPPTS